jgi:intraflagellar transport protein 88
MSALSFAPLLCAFTCSRLEEEARSLGYYQDAHRVWPVNLDVISWLGAFHVRSEVYERAIPYFELAAAIQPQEVKWALMTASCYRRIGAYGPALKQ